MTKKSVTDFIAEAQRELDKEEDDKDEYIKRLDKLQNAVDCLLAKIQCGIEDKPNEDK